MTRKSHHVVTNGLGGWDIKKGGGSKSIKHFDIKTDAISQARVISINQQSELVIHGKNGKIQRSDSHGGDPIPPRDEK